MLNIIKASALHSLQTNAKFTAKAVVAAFAATVAFSAPAQAGCSSGFLANFLCETGILDQQSAKVLDGLNAATGQPVDRFANQLAGRAADVVAPGSGVFVTGTLEARRMQQNSQRSQPFPLNSPSQASDNSYEPRFVLPQQDFFANSRVRQTERRKTGGVRMRHVKTPQGEKLMVQYY